jgi:RNA polymerase sigma-70 factor (ECF subfamily)
MRQFRVVAQPVAAVLPDEVLIARAQQDPAQFAAVYDRFFDQVFWYCYGRLRNREIAEDAVSLIFEKVFTSLHRLNVSDRTFRPWLFRIAHNVVVDVVRARKPTESVEAAAELVDGGPTPEETYLESERRRQVIHLLPELPEGQRRVVEMRLAGLDTKEISDVLGVSTGAVASTQFRAVSSIRALLNLTPPGKEDGDVQF